MSAPFELSNQLALDDSGNPLPGAKLEFYVSGTTTPLDTYSNFGNSTPNANPVVADASGRFGSIYLKPQLYKVILKSSAGVALWTKDPYTGHPFVYESALPGAAFPGLIVRNTSDGNSYQRNTANSAWINLGPTDAVANTASVSEILAGTATDKVGTPDSIAGLWEQGADITAASTLSLPATGGGVFRVTGSSTTIAAINSAANGREVELFLVNSQTFSDGAGIETLTGTAMTLAADTIVRFRRIASVWRMVHTSAGGGTLPRGALWGLILSNNTTDPTNDIDVSAGSCRDASDAENFVVSTAITKRLDANWSVGTNQGGLDTGSIANATYHVYVIRRPDTGVVDAIFSTSASSPTLPSGYTQYRRIGSILREGGVIVPFVQHGDSFLRLTPVIDVDAANPGTSAVSRTLKVPTGIKVVAEITAAVFAASGNPTAVISSLDGVDVAPQAFATTPLTGFSNVGSMSGATPNAWGQFANISVLTNTSAQIRSRLSTSSASDRLGIITRGWSDLRGRLS